MAEILGVRAAIDLVTPTGVDATKIYEFSTRMNMTPTEIMQLMATGVGSVNEFIATRYGGLLGFTDEMFAYYRQGVADSRFMTPEGTEFGEPDPRRGAQIGHMLPLKHFHDALGWSQWYLKNAREGQVIADVNELTDAWLNRVDFDVVKRALTKAENPIGAVGYDVGWAIGSGTNVNYIPPQWRANEFAATHSHYNTYNTSGGKTYDDLFNDDADDLRHHGFTGKIAFIVSKAALPTIRALSNFVPLIPGEITAIIGSNTTFKYFGQGEFEGFMGELVGWYNGTWGAYAIAYHERFPTGYTFAHAVTGPKPLAIRVETGEPFGLIPDVQVTSTITPKLNQVAVRAWHGVGVNDRLSGVASQIGAGVVSYTDPSDATLGA